MQSKECRSFDFKVRATNNEKHGNFIEGRAIVFGQPYDNGYFIEYIDDGALDKTDLRDVRLLVNHDTNMIPLARSRNNNENSTMQLTVVPGGGMDFRADLDTEGNPTAKSLYSAAGRGDISGCSFMFEVGEDRWENLDTDKPTRFITDIRKVFEVSCCTFPAYEQTTLEARSSADVLDSAKATLESVRAEAEKEERNAEIEAVIAKIKKIRGN